MGAKIKNRYRLKGKDTRNVQESITQWFPLFQFPENAVVETGFLDDVEIVVIDQHIIFFKHEQSYFFTLEGLYLYKPKEKFVIVDMGAISFVTNGADIMAAGIVEADDEILIGDMVWIGDLNYRKPIAVGVALVSGEDMVLQQKGKAVKSIHYVGDTLWNAIKEVS